MKTQLILALTLSVLAANTFAADGADRTNGGLAANSSASSTLIVEGGADRLQERGLAEGGADRLQERGLAEGGADRLQERGLAEGGADRLKGNTIAEDGADRLNASHLS